MVRARRASILVVMTMLAVGSLKAQVQAPADLDLDARRGWYWGFDPPSEAEEPVEEAPRELPPPPGPAELMDMHPDRFEPLLKSYLRQAVWRPTPEHVRDYYRVQDVARRKAAAFAAVTQAVMMAHPQLDVGREYPVTNPGRNAAVQARNEAIARRLARARNDWGLILFASPRCPYCPAARATLGLFLERHGWDGTEVDADRNPGAAARFGVDYTPSLILARRGSEEWFPVQSGTQSLPALEEAVYRALRLLAGEIRPEQFFTLDHEMGGVFDPLAAPRAVPDDALRGRLP